MNNQMIQTTPTPAEKAVLAFRHLIRKNEANECDLVALVLRGLLHGDDVVTVESPRDDLVDVITTSTELPGWELSSVHGLGGNLQAPMELRLHGVLFAQSWDAHDWAVGHYIEEGVNLVLNGV